MNLLTELETLLSPYGIKTHCYIDRLHLYLDASTSVSQLSPLLQKDHQTGADSAIAKNINKALRFQSLPHHAHLDKKLELLQPDWKHITRLHKLIRGDYVIQYVEFALDFEAQDRDALVALQAFFDKHFVYDEHPEKRAKRFHCALVNGNKTSKDGNLEGTRYYAARKSGLVFTLYMRDTSKVTAQRACLHLEWRLSGVKQLKAQNIITLPQLLAFELEQFWNERLDLREPNFTQLGEMLRPINKSKTSRQADINRGKKKWRDLSVLQKFLYENPYCAASFTQITTASKLKHCLCEFLLQPILSTKRNKCSIR